MKLRQATKDDLDGIIALQMINAHYHASMVCDGKIKASTESFFRKQTLESIQHKEREVIVGELGKSIMAYGIAWLGQDHPIFDIGKQGLIDDIYISSDYQRQGYGHMLVEKLIDWFKDHSVTKVELNVYQMNTKGVEFWNKQGFSPMLKRMTKGL